MRVVLLVLVVLAGCMVGPDYVRPPAPTPDQWGEIHPASESRATYDPMPADWWTTFDDPHLTSLVERAVTSNLDLQQAASRVRQARAQRRITSSALWPSVGSSASYSRQRTSENAPSSAAGRTFDLWQAGFDASWEIDVFGGIVLHADCEPNGTVPFATFDRTDLPSAPSGLLAVAGDGSAALGWSPPADVGGSPISAYHVGVFNSTGGAPTGVTGATTRTVPTSVSSPGRLASQLPPCSAARSTTSEPGRMPPSMSAVTSTGAFFPGTAAAAITTSLSATTRASSSR